jgi:hypothetical protein
VAGDRGVERGVAARAARSEVVRRAAGRERLTIARRNRDDDADAEPIHGLADSKRRALGKYADARAGPSTKQTTPLFC